MRAIHVRSSVTPLAVLNLACALAATGTIPARASDWPGFRGPNADGISAETAPMTSFRHSSPSNRRTDRRAILPGRSPR